MLVPRCVCVCAHSSHEKKIANPTVFGVWYEKKKYGFDLKFNEKLGKAVAHCPFCNIEHMTGHNFHPKFKVEWGKHRYIFLMASSDIVIHVAKHFSPVGQGHFCGSRGGWDYIVFMMLQTLNEQRSEWGRLILRGYTFSLATSLPFLFKLLWCTIESEVLGKLLSSQKITFVPLMNRYSGDKTVL